MDRSNKKENMKLTPSQIAWVVKDLEKSKIFFQEMFGVKNFMPTATSLLQDYSGTYYGQLVDAENLVSMTYSCGTFIEIIQPISGKSIFKDFLDNNPTGGIQHIAYSTPIINLDNVISDFKKRGFNIVSRFDTTIANIVFFDTREEIGVFTEIMGITKEGEIAVQEMKTKMAQG
jgi:catechol 2,3-dioxygenase-like lactoylglutathione lyase family enzyme